MTWKRKRLCSQKLYHLFFVVENYNFKIVYTNDTKMRKVNEKNCEKYLYSFLWHDII